MKDKITHGWSEALASEATAREEGYRILQAPKELEG